jgi:hypothetical protein
MGEIAGGDDGQALELAVSGQMAWGKPFAGGPGVAGMDMQIGQILLHDRGHTGIGQQEQEAACGD